MKENEDMNYERAIVFSKRGTAVHISKNNGVFYNGIILEVSKEFFFIDDKEDGRQLIFFIELKKPIEEFREAT